MTRPPGQDDDVIRSFAAGAGAIPNAATDGSGDVVADRLTVLAARISGRSATGGPSTAVADPPWTPSPDWNSPITYSERLKLEDGNQARLAARVAALAVQDAPGHNVIDRADPVVPAPAPVRSEIDVGLAMPASARTDHRSEVVTPRLAEMILQRRASLEQLERDLADITPPASAETPVAGPFVPPMPSSPPPGEGFEAQLASLSRVARASVEPMRPAAPEPPAPVPAAQPATRRGAEPRSTARERGLSDGLPGLLAGLLISVAIGAAIYILLRPV